eukprot:UN04434
MIENFEKDTIDMRKELISVKKILKEEHSNCDTMSTKVHKEYEENIRQLKTLQHDLQNKIDNMQQPQNQNI